MYVRARDAVPLVPCICAARTSKAGSAKTNDMATRGVAAVRHAAEPQWMRRCVKMMAAPAAHGSARICWNASFVGSAACNGSGAPSSSGSPAHSFQLHQNTHDDGLKIDCDCARVTGKVRGCLDSTQRAQVQVVQITCCGWQLLVTPSR